MFKKQKKKTKNNGNY